MGGIRRPLRRAIVVAKNLSLLFIPEEEELDAVAEVFSEIGIEEL